MIENFLEYPSQNAHTQQIGKFLEYPSEGTLILNRLESFWNSLHKERSYSTVKAIPETFQSIENERSL
jgi:threonyl-tRNA synthetase